MGGEVTPSRPVLDDSVAIIGPHINTSTVTPAWHHSQRPRPLKALRPLAKDPSERPESSPCK